MIDSTSNTRTADKDDARRALDVERHELLQRISEALEMPMAVLGLVWLLLLVLDFTRGLSPFLRGVNYLIWALFLLQLVVEFALAPKKLEYLRHNWLTAIALALPAMRVLSVFRIARALGALRGLGLVRVIGAMNRGMGALSQVMGRRGFGYVLTLTLLVNVAGAAGMYGFEHGAPHTGIDSFGSALWWTAMVLTTMGSDYFPRSPEGRLLCLLLATYGFAVFGYVTATIASFFVARDADTPEGEVAGARQIDSLRQEIAALHGKLDALSAALANHGAS